MIELLKLFVKILLSPMVHVPIILFVSLLLLKINYRKMGTIMLAISVGWYWMASTSFLSARLVKPLENQYPPTYPEQISKYHPEVIVVLACYYYDDDLLPPISRWPECSLKRLMHAYWLHRETNIPIAVTGGAISGTDTDHANRATNFLKMLGVGPDNIFTISEGANTQQEAQVIHKAGFNKVVLVTTAVHMPRTVNEFRRLGINVLASPTDHLSKINDIPIFDWPNAVSMRRTERAIYEYMGLAYQRVKYGSHLGRQLEQY